MRYLSLGLLLFVPLCSRADEPKPTCPAPQDVRAAFLKLLDRPRPLLSVKNEGGEKTDDGLIVERLSFASEKRGDDVERVPLMLVRPENIKKKLPVVIVLHGTGGTKEGQKEWLKHLAKRGIIGVAIDGRYHGQRAGDRKGTEAYNGAITAAWRTKDGEKHAYPFYFDTCWDVWRTIDYLETRDDVDADRIGLMGISKGGIETWLAGAVDERVKVAVPMIGVQSFRWSLENDKWQARANTIKAAHEAAAKDLGEDKVNAKVCRALWNKVIPGILDEFDGPSMLRLFAGRPLLIINGELDPNCPLEGAKLAFAAAEQAYRDKGCADRLKIMVENGKGHTVTNEGRTAALEWMEKWLKP